MGPAEYVLPEKKAAAEELRLQTSASKTPSMGSAARAAAAVRSEHELRIQSLHADICKVPTSPEEPPFHNRSWSAASRVPVKVVEIER